MLALPVHVKKHVGENMHFAAPDVFDRYLASVRRNGQTDAKQPSMTNRQTVASVSRVSTAEHWLAYRAPLAEQTQQ